MNKKDEFNHVFNLMQEDEEFNSYCVKHELDEDQQRYIVVSVMDSKLNDKEKCSIIEMKYNSRYHQRYKKDHDHDSRVAVIFMKLTNVRDQQPKERGSLTSVLEAIIHGDARDSDKVKALETLVKLQDKAEGSHVLKPWERLWCDVIIPNMLVQPELQPTH